MESIRDGPDTCSHAPTHNGGELAKGSINRLLFYNGEYLQEVYFAAD